jgi:hypothetical protein
MDPIMRRNRYLHHVHDMLTGAVVTTTTTTTTTMQVSTTLLTLPPPPCSLWATVLGKVGLNGTQGATPVYTFLRDRLATWITPRKSKNDVMIDGSMLAILIFHDTTAAHHVPAKHHLLLFTYFGCCFQLAAIYSRNHSILMFMSGQLSLLRRYKKEKTKNDERRNEFTLVGGGD